MGNRKLNSVLFRNNMVNVCTSLFLREAKFLSKILMISFAHEIFSQVYVFSVLEQAMTGGAVPLLTGRGSKDIKMRLELEGGKVSLLKHFSLFFAVNIKYYFVVLV